MRNRLPWFALAMFVCAPAHATTWHIAPDGSGDLPTIAAALAVAAYGDSVLLACGTYYEHDLDLPSGVTLHSPSPQCATIDAQQLGRVVFVDLADSTTRVEGITIAGGLADLGARDLGNHGGGLYSAHSSVRVRNCVFRNNAAQFGSGAAFLHEGDALVENCIFRSNVVVSGRVRVTFSRCFFDQTFLASYDLALAIIRRCTFWQTGIWSNARGDLDVDHTIADHVVCNDPGTSVKVTCSLIPDFSSYCDPPDSTNFTGNPLFCNPAQGDFRIAANSPCIIPSGPCAGIVGAYGVGCGPTDSVTVTVSTSPPGLAMAVDGVSYLMPHSFRWLRWSEHLLGGAENVAAEPGRRWNFRAWSDGGEASHFFWATSSAALEATYQEQFELVTSAELENRGQSDRGGTDLVTPASGWFDAGSNVTLQALPSAGLAFHQWLGSGAGSYTGGQNPATITIIGPVQEIAQFGSFGYALSLSASDVDPHENESAPSGTIRMLHLWLTCSHGGLAAIELDARGSLSALGFLPADGVIAAGGIGQLTLAPVGCWNDDRSPIRLGAWVVLDDGGSLCPTEPVGGDSIRVWDCQTPAQVTTAIDVTGFSSDGTPPCRAGVGSCGPSTTGLGVPAALASAPRSVIYAPNPFADRAELRFQLARPGQVRLRAYDVQGRFVREVFEGHLPAGSHAISWDGRNRSGSDVASGTYFLRLEADDRVTTTKVIRVRH